MIEVLNKWLLGVLAVLIVYSFYKAYFSKNKNLIVLEKEYTEILHSDKYKVKGK